MVYVVQPDTTEHFLFNSVAAVALYGIDYCRAEPDQSICMTVCLLSSTPL